jgi:hypothetical protein
MASIMPSSVVAGVRSSRWPLEPEDDIPCGSASQLLHTMDSTRSSRYSGCQVPVLGCCRMTFQALKQATPFLPHGLACTAPSAKACVWRACVLMRDDACAGRADIRKNFYSQIPATRRQGGHAGPHGSTVGQETGRVYGQ